MGGLREKSKPIPGPFGPVLLTQMCLSQPLMLEITGNYAKMEKDMRAVLQANIIIGHFRGMCRGSRGRHYKSGLKEILNLLLSSLKVYSNRKINTCYAISK